MILGEAKYATATSESIDTFNGFSKIDISAFNNYHTDFKVTVEGNNESNIIRICDTTFMCFVFI